MTVNQCRKEEHVKIYLRITNTCGVYHIRYILAIFVNNVILIRIFYYIVEQYVRGIIYYLELIKN